MILRGVVGSVTRAPIPCVRDRLSKWSMSSSLGGQALGHGLTGSLDPIRVAGHAIRRSPRGPERVDYP
jgi:hypothetical protein